MSKTCPKCHNDYTDYENLSFIAGNNMCIDCYEDIKETLLNKIHIKWLSKAKIAVINGEEMTVLPYGYLTQACSEAINQTREETIREMEEKIIRYQNGFRMGEYGEELAPEYGVIDDLLKQVFPKEEVKPMVEQIPF